MARKMAGTIGLLLACALSVGVLAGCPTAGTFDVVLKNTGHTNTIVGCYLVARDVKVDDWGPNLLAKDAQGAPIPIGPRQRATLGTRLKAGPTYDYMVAFQDAVGTTENREYPVSADGHKLVFDAGIATSLGEDAITAHALLEESATGWPTYSIGYSWGPPLD